MWNPFVWTIEVPYTKRQLARMEAERIAQSVPVAVPVAVPAAPPLVNAAHVVDIGQATPPAHAGCQWCTANPVSLEGVPPHLLATVNAILAAGASCVQHTSPTTPSVHADRQRTTTNHANTQKSEVKYSRKAAAEEHQHQKSKRIHSAFKTTNTARKVKRVSWAMDGDESSSSTSTSSQTKKASDPIPPSSASSATRRAVRVAARELLDERPDADDSDSETGSDNSSAIDTDTQDIPMSTVYDKRGLYNESTIYRPEESDPEYDSTSSSDSAPPVRRHSTPKYPTYTQQEKPRNTDHPHSSQSQRQGQGNDWKLKTAAPSFNTNIIPPRPQSRRSTQFAQEESDSDHESAIDDRVPKHRYPTSGGSQRRARQDTRSAQGLPTNSHGSTIDDRRRSMTGGRHPQPQQVAFSVQDESDSEYGNAIDDRVPKHRRQTSCGPGPQSQHLARSAQGLPTNNHGSAIDDRRRSTTEGRQPQQRQVARSAQDESDSEYGSAIDDCVPKHRRPTNKESEPQSRHFTGITQGVPGASRFRTNESPVRTSLRPQNNSIERNRSPSLFRASSHQDSAKEAVNHLVSDPLWRINDDPLSSYHNDIAQYYIKDAYRQVQSQSQNTVKKEANCRVQVPQSRVPYNRTKDTPNASPLGTRRQSTTAKKGADHRVEPTRRIVSEPYRQDGWHQPVRTVSPSPTREHSRNARYDSDRSMERPRVASEPRPEQSERSKYQPRRSPTPPPTHEHFRKYRRSRSPSPSKARFDPIIILRAKAKDATTKNGKLVFVYRTKAKKGGVQKGGVQAGEGIRIKRATSGVDRPSAPSCPSYSDSALKEGRSMSGGLGFGDKKKPKGSHNYKPPTAESDSSDDLPNGRNGAGVTWRDV